MRIGKSCVRCIGWTYANWICVWGIIALLGVVVGCGTKGREFDGLEAVGKSESALQGGAPAGAGMEDLHAVARLVIPGNAGYCTATLIADRVILTAAHCLTPFGSGCRGAVKPPDDTYVQFADADGDPNGPGSEKIRVLGYAVHPNAWGSRVKDCGIPNPPYTRCFDFMPASEPPSCNLIEVCANDPTTVAAGLHTEHDLAIGFLAKKPTNSSIAPIPVITSNDFLSSGPWVESFLSSGKYVTHVGYGEGSTEWNGARGRDMGTAPVIDIQTGVTRRDSCNGNNDVDEIVPSIVTTIAVHEDAYIDSGDSGGPVLAGPGPVVGNMTPPSILPIWMEQRRHVIGVHSTGSQTKLTGTVPCSSSEPCESGLSCWKNSDGNYRCQIECTTDVDCPPDGRCGEARDGIKGCFGIKSYSAPTYIPENGDWIHEVLERNDIDLDGKANEDDNCPGVPNPDQVNSNFEAERDRQADKLGDACDPVPTPRVSMGLDYSLPQPHYQGCYASTPYWEIQSRIELEFIGSHNLINGAEVGQQDLLTEFRFCQANPLYAWDCAVGSGQRTDQDFDSADDEFSVWRDITITELGPRGASALYDYPASPYPGDLNWDYWEDNYHWDGDGWLGAGVNLKPPLTPVQSWFDSSHLRGTIGVRAGGPKSATVLGTINNWTNGVHVSPDLNDGCAMGECLSRYYVDAEPDPKGTRSGHKCQYCVGGNCMPKVFDVSQLGDYKQIITDPPDWRSSPDILVLLKDPLSQWGYVSKSGMLLQAPGLISQTLDFFLSHPSYLYVPAVEPFMAQGIVYHNTTGVFLVNDATGISDSVLVSPQGFVMQSRHPNAPFGNGPKNRQLPGITARTGYTPLFSRILGSVFIIGGSDVNGATHEIWMVPDGALPTQLVVPGYQPYHVIAATIATSDRMLWILDQQPGSNNTWTARLVRINIRSMAHEIVWQGPRSWVFDSHWLTVDRDGQVLLTGSSSSTHTNVVIKFKSVPFSMGTAEPVLMQILGSTLLGPPVVDSNGYLLLMPSMLMQSLGGISSIRVPELLNDAPNGINLADCM